MLKIEAWIGRSGWGCALRLSDGAEGQPASQAIGYQNCWFSLSSIMMDHHAVSRTCRHRLIHGMNDGQREAHSDRSHPPEVYRASALKEKSKCQQLRFQEYALMTLAAPTKPPIPGVSARSLTD